MKLAEMSKSYTHLRWVFFSVVIALALPALVGCVSMTPSSHPRPPTPTPLPIPSPFPQPSDPSSSPPGAPGSPSPIPTPPDPHAMPSPTPPPVTSMPSRPSISAQQKGGRPSSSSPTTQIDLSTGIPKPNSGGGEQSQNRSSSSSSPSIPGLPQPRQRGGQGGEQSDSGEPSDSSEGGSNNTQGSLPQGELGDPSEGSESHTGTDGEQQEGGTLTEQRSGDESLSGSEDGSEDGTLPDGGQASARGGDEQAGGPEIVQAGSPGQGMHGDSGMDEDADDGWSVSNELPDAEKVRSPSEREGGSELADGNSQDTNDAQSGGDGTEPRISASDAKLANVLSGIDGRIRDDRADQADRTNEQAGGPALPGDAVLEETSGGDKEGEDGQSPSEASLGGDSTQKIPREGKDSVGNEQGEGSKPGLSGQPRKGDMGDDAKDDDVVARQLREAAMAETDPELKAALWEELRRYQDKRK